MAAKHSINRSRVKEMALSIAANSGRGRFTRVSESFIDRIEAQVSSIVAQEVHKHPSLGITLK